MLAYDVCQDESVPERHPPPAIRPAKPLNAILHDMGDVRDTPGVTPGVGTPEGLGPVGERRTVRVGGIEFAGRRRRPSGEKPPLPRDLKRSGWVWLAFGVLVVLLWLSLFSFPVTTDWWTRMDHKVLTWLVDRRTDAMNNLMEVVQYLADVGAGLNGIAGRHDTAA